MVPHPAHPANPAYAARENVPRVAFQLGVVLVLLLLVILGLRHIAMPAVSTLEIAPSAFSASRAMRHITHIAQAPHPIGSPEVVRVRSYLLEQIKALGYAPELQGGTIVLPDKRTVATVQNIVVRVPGSVPGKALLLAAHYDSAPGSPGGADDGASIGAILETLRALKQGAPLRNDLIVLFSDGEEAGLLGAHYFISHSPLVKNIGVALNFEFRGNSGPVWMFDSSGQNGKLIQEWASAAPRPLGSSLLYEIYRLMPNDTDLTAFKPAFPGLGFAAGEQYNSYHTALDSAQLLNKATLQELGDTMLALARHFGNRPLEHMAAADVVYFDLPGIGVVSYGGSAALALGGLVLLGFAGVLVWARRSGQARLRRIARATLVILLGCILLAVVCQLIWLGLRQVHPGYPLLLHGSTYNGNWYLAAFAALSVAGFVWMLNKLQPRFAPIELALGALMLNMLALAATSVLLPGASFLFTWPVLPVLLALGLLLAVPRLMASTNLMTLLLLAAAAPAVLLFTPLFHLLYFALTPLMLAGTILFGCLLLCVISPLLVPAGHGKVLRRTALGGSLALFIAGAMTSGFDAERPQPNNLFYTQDDATGPAYLVSDDEKLDSWSLGVLAPAPRQQALLAVFGPHARPMWVRSTAVHFNQAPSVEVLSDRVDGLLRHIDVAVRSPRQAPRIAINVDGAKVLQAKVQGQAYTLRETDNWKLDAYGMADQPVQLALTLPKGVRFTLRVRDLSYGIAPGVGARPANMISQPFRYSDTLHVAHLTHFD
jgi:hypothetical protein